MLGNNSITLCPAEVKRALRNYFEDVWNLSDFEITTIQSSDDNFVIHLKGTETYPPKTLDATQPTNP